MSLNEPIFPNSKVLAGSNRSFGVVFAAAFAAYAFWPLIAGKEPHLWAGGVATAFALAALARPQLLTPLNQLWFRVGLVLHRVVNPIIMGLVFFAAVVPVGAVLRLLGKDVLRLQRDRNAESYWIQREPPGPEPGSMSKQF